MLNEIQKALTVQDAYRLLVGKRVSGRIYVRNCSVIECERLQGFPDNWTNGVTEKERFKLLGNAVTTNVVSHVSKCLLSFVGQINDEARVNSVFDMQKSTDDRANSLYIQ